MPPKKRNRNGEDEEVQWDLEELKTMNRDALDREAELQRQLEECKKEAAAKELQVKKLEFKNFLEPIFLKATQERGEEVNLKLKEQAEERGIQEVVHPGEVGASDPRWQLSHENLGYEFRFVAVETATELVELFTSGNLKPGTKVFDSRPNVQPENRLFTLLVAYELISGRCFTHQAGFEHLIITAISSEWRYHYKLAHHLAEHVFREEVELLGSFTSTSEALGEYQQFFVAPHINCVFEWEHYPAEVEVRIGAAAYNEVLKGVWVPDTEKKDGVKRQMMVDLDLDRMLEVQSPSKVRYLGFHDNGIA